MAKRLLGKIHKIVNFFSTLESEISMTTEKIIFNQIYDRPGHLANFIVLVLKSYLYSCRCTKKIPTVFGLENKIIECQRYELYNAKRNGKCRNYYKKWYNLKINEQYEETEYTHEYLLNIM